VTFAAPLPELLDHDDNSAGPLLTSGDDDSRPLPPPPPGAVPSPGPTPWSLGRGVDPFDVALPSRGTRSVVGREVVDAFELIWPTGEIDEQFLGGPLSEMPAPGALSVPAPHPIDLKPSPLPMTVRLKPLTGPPHVDEPAWSEPVSDDVVLAIQRAIAAIGSEIGVVDEPPPAPRVPDRADESVGGVPGDLVALDAGMAIHPEPNDYRRSALKRLISGLRRH
jgi:hypothetical protein